MIFSTREFSRRAFLGSLLGTAMGASFARALKAEEDNLFPLRADDGKPVVNYRLPSEFSPVELPGIIWHGSEKSDVMLIEFFDYNCPFCRRAAADLDALAGKDAGLRLGLANNAVLGLGSYLTARVQQAVLRLYGPDRAYAFHRLLFAHRGPNDGVAALSLAKGMGLDVTAVQDSANSDMIGAVVKRHVQLAAELGFAVSPSFVLSSVGILGYPGQKSIARMIAASRKCDQPACG